MELNHLRYFFEVARAGSFSGAASRLRVSQPSLSKTVALLEAREGVKLLERSKKGVALTDIGREIFQDCEDIFQKVVEVENKCRHKTRVCEGPLRFGASDHIADYLLPAKVMEMRDRHPAVTPSVFVGSPRDIIDKLQKRELEFGLFFTKLESPDLHFRPLISVPLAVVYRTPKGVRAAAPSRYIGSPVRDYRTAPAQEVLTLLDRKADTHFETNSQELQKRLCLAGAGMAVLARFMVEEELEKKILTEHKLPKPRHAEIYLVRRKTHTYSLNARTFLDLLGQNKD